MPRSRFPIIAAALVALASFDARGETVKVIVNASLGAQEISAQDLKSVFLLEKNSLSDGTHVEPVLRKNGEMHKAFVKRFLGLDDDGLQRLYSSRVFSGQGSMPKTLGSDAEVVAYVRKTRGAIGYVSNDSTTEGVGILEVVDVSAGTERQLITRVEPIYPEELRVRSIGGVVSLKITITAKGEVSNVQLLGGNPILGDAASTAVGKWRYASSSSRTTMKVQIPFGAVSK